MEFKAINIKELGRLIAHASDQEQCEIVNSLAYELKVCCKDGGLEGMQICYMAAGLDSNGKELIKSLAEFIKIREEQKPEEN